MAAKPTKDKSMNAGDWEKAASGPWKQVYVSELYWLTHESVRVCDRIFESVEPAPPGQYYLRVDFDIHSRIYGVLNNAARIRALIKPRPRRRDQSARQYAFQDHRTKWLAGLVAGLPTDEIFHAKVRNSLEHFDEYLDTSAIRLADRVNGGRGTVMPLDMTFSEPSVLSTLTPDSVVYPLRVYLAEERVFENCGVRIDLGKLAAECEGLRGRLQEHELTEGFLDDEGERAGASIFVL